LALPPTISSATAAGENWGSQLKRQKKKINGKIGRRTIIKQLDERIKQKIDECRSCKVSLYKKD